MSDIKSMIAVLDANVLYPAPLRDFLLRLAEVDLSLTSIQASAAA
jgi:hypothetical protein